MWPLVAHNTNTSNNTFKERGRLELYVCESNCGDYSDIRKLLLIAYLIGKILYFFDDAILRIIYISEKIHFKFNYLNMWFLKKFINEYIMYQEFDFVKENSSWKKECYKISKNIRFALRIFPFGMLWIFPVASGSYWIIAKTMQDENGRFLLIE